jgi:DHA1 family bicyclomycin/chloramphenicol resistance-like MFS transporter
VQLSLTACLLGLAVGQLFAGPISDRRGRRGLLLASVAAYVVVSALCSVAPSVEVLIVLRLGQGLAGSAGIVIARAITRDLYEGPELSRIFSRLLIVSLTAPVLAPILGAQVLRFTSWRGTFGALTLIGLVILVAVVALVPETLPAERRTDHRVRDDVAVYGRMLRSSHFLPYVLVTGMFGAMLFAFVAGSPFVVQDVYGHSATVFSLVFAFVSAGMIAAGQANARLVARRGAARLLRVAMVVSVVGSASLLAVALAGPAAGMGPWVAALALAVAPNGVVSPNASALAMEEYGDNAGAAAALLGLAMFALGAGVAPLVGAMGASAVPMAAIMLAATVTGLALLQALAPRRAAVVAVGP